MNMLVHAHTHTYANTLHIYTHIHRLEMGESPGHPVLEKWKILRGSVVAVYTVVVSLVRGER